MLGRTSIIDTVKGSFHKIAHRSKLSSPRSHKDSQIHMDQGSQLALYCLWHLAIYLLLEILILYDGSRQLPSPSPPPLISHHRPKNSSHARRIVGIPSSNLGHGRENTTVWSGPFWKNILSLPVIILNATVSCQGCHLGTVISQDLSDPIQQKKNISDK